MQETVRIVRAERLADGSVVVELAVKRRMVVAGELFEWEDREPFVHNAVPKRWLMQELTRKILNYIQKRHRLDLLLAMYSCQLYGSV